MEILVKVKTGAKSNTVERVEQEALPLEAKKPVCYRVSVKARPIGGEANRAIARALADYFDIAISCVLLKSGQTSKQKIFEILL